MMTSKQTIVKEAQTQNASSKYKMVVPIALALIIGGGLFGFVSEAQAGDHKSLRNKILNQVGSHISRVSKHVGHASSHVKGRVSVSNSHTSCCRSRVVYQQSPGYYKTSYQRVCVRQGYYTRRYVAPIYAWRCDSWGRRYQVCVRAGYYTSSYVQPVYQNKSVRVWVAGRTTRQVVRECSRNIHTRGPVVSARISF